MKKSRALLALALVVMTAVAALANHKTARKEKLGAELGKAPPKAASLRNPYAGQPDAIQAGKKVFRRHCAGCHGPDGHGGASAPDLHSAVIQNAPPGVLFWFLRNGNLKEGMPSWSRLPDQRLWQIVSYLKTFDDSRGLRTF